MSFLLVIIGFISIFQHVSCAELSLIIQAPGLAPRPKDSAKFLQSLAQLHQAFGSPKNLSPMESLTQIIEQRKRFDREINQQRLNIREKYVQIKEKRERLNSIKMQLENEYASIKNKNHKILTQIDPAKYSHEMNLIIARTIKKIKNGNYHPARASDSSEGFDTLYKIYNVPTAQEDALKKIFYLGCMNADMNEYISMTINGCTCWYKQVTNIIEIVLVDLSNPESEWKVEKEKREALYQEMREICLAIQDEPKKIALIQSQIEERNKKIAHLMLKEQTLLNQANIQTMQDDAAKEFDKKMSQKMNQDFAEYISNI